VKAAPEAFDEIPLKRGRGGRYPVMIPKAVLSSLNQARPAKISQVPRRGGLGNLNDAYDVPHAQLSAEQETQNPQARSIRKSPEHQVDLGLCFPHILARAAKSEQSLHDDYVMPNAVDLPVFFIDPNFAEAERFQQSETGFVLDENPRHKFPETGLLRFFHKPFHSHSSEPVATMRSRHIDRKLRDALVARPRPIR